MERNFSQHVKEILGYSREEAERLQNSNIVPSTCCWGLYAMAPTVLSTHWWGWELLFAR